MMRAYRVMEEKLRASMADQVALDNAIKDLKVRHYVAVSAMSCGA